MGNGVNLKRGADKRNIAPMDATSTPSTPWRVRYLQRFYYGRPGWINGTREFHQLIQSVAGRFEKPRVLEIGPGPESATTRFMREVFGDIDGLDIDEQIRKNTDLRQAFVYDGKKWPIQDQSYDLIVADWVMEHVQNPAEMLSEVRRVLAPGGVFVFRTPNLFHYVSMASRLTPHWFHLAVARRLKGNADHVHDEYPTWYRTNTAATIRRLCRRAKLREIELRQIEKEPSYASVSRVLFLMFMIYERLVNGTPLLAWARVTILCAVAKPAEPNA